MDHFDRGALVREEETRTARKSVHFMLRCTVDGSEGPTAFEQYAIVAFTLYDQEVHSRYMIHGLQPAVSIEQDHRDMSDEELLTLAQELAEAYVRSIFPETQISDFTAEFKGWA